MELEAGITPGYIQTPQDRTAIHATGSANRLSKVGSIAGTFCPSLRHPGSSIRTCTAFFSPGKRAKQWSKIERGRDGKTELCRRMRHVQTPNDLAAPHNQVVRIMHLRRSLSTGWLQIKYFQRSPPFGLAWSATPGTPLVAPYRIVLGVERTPPHPSRPVPRPWNAGG